MSEKDPIRLFVTHTFQEHEDYARVFEYLETVEWNDHVIAETVRRLARGEENAKWDVIEFDMD